jgi:AAHS family 4-hydroxybenzoate transporter-like MFS transporter
MTSSAVATVNVSEFLDHRRFGRHHLTVLLLGAILNLIDSFDVYIIAFVLVPMAEWFKVSPAALTPMLVAQQFGLVLSAYVLGPFA